MTGRSKKGKPDHTQDKTDPPYQGAVHLGIRREIGTREVRCLHTDPDRPPLKNDLIEFHWRCPAWFHAEEDELPYCPLHRELYRSKTNRYPTIEERREIVKKLTPKAAAFLRSALPADSPILNDLPLSRTADPWTGKETMSTAEEDAAAAQRKADQLARARAEGLIP